MAKVYRRIGECNLCGECCGYPRATDGGQNNAWPASWPDSLKEWNKKDLPELFKLVDRDKEKGTAMVKNKEDVNYNNYEWRWVKGRGLCKNGRDLSCPFLAKKMANGEVPCLLYGTEHHDVWQNMCRPVPPEIFETKEQIDNWFRNCPSCSYTYEEVLEGEEEAT